MRGQLNLFTFPITLKFVEVATLELRDELLKSVSPGYSFCEFDRTYNYDKEGKNIKASIIIAYRKNTDEVVGFCTISWSSHEHKLAGIDVWVLIQYRDLGFGSILVRSANEECLKRIQTLPNGHDKNHTHCWAAKVNRRNAERTAYESEFERTSSWYSRRNNYEQLNLLKHSDMPRPKEFYLTQLSRLKDGMDSVLLGICLNGIRLAYPH